MTIANKIKVNLIIGYYNFIFSKKLFLLFLIKNIIKIASFFIHPLKGKHLIYSRKYMKKTRSLKNKKLLKISQTEFLSRVYDISTLLEVYSYNYYTLLKNFLPNENDIVFDLGAGIGEYTFLASQQAKMGKVIAIEPNMESFNLLVENIKLNKIKNVIPLRMAISNKKCKVKIYQGSTSHIDSIFKKRSKHFYIVNSLTLDSIFKKMHLKKVDLIKIDIEGAEYLALIGAKHILKKFKPKIIMEIHNQKIRRNVLNFLKVFNYQIELEKQIYKNPNISIIYLS